MKKIMSILVIVLIATASFAQSNQPVIKLKGDVYQTTLFHDNGTIAQTGFYTKQGVLTGEWISYDTAGVKTAVAQYDNGNRVGTWYFYQGETIKEVTYTSNAIATVNTWTKTDTRVVSN